jgi:hypothetical protein
MCGDLNCKLRQRVTLSDDGTLKTKRPVKKEKPADIEPLNPDEL